MFEYLKGTLTDKYSSQTSTYFVVDVNGVGYKLEVSSSDFQSITELDTEIKIYTKLLHKEDSMTLCGFLKKETRDIFTYLTSVSGVGSKMALALLGQFDTFNLISIVINENYKELTLAKGIGTKLAQKIILELKDKLIKANLSVLPENLSIPEYTEAYKETSAILLSLGYTEDEVNTALQIIINKCENKNDPEEILRESLKYLSM
jgi:Holliday junction DNA helicase RuvA